MFFTYRKLFLLANIRIVLLRIPMTFKLSFPHDHSTNMIPAKSGYFQSLSLRILQGSRRWLSWFYMLLLCKKISSLLFPQDLIIIFIFHQIWNVSPDSPPYSHSLVLFSSMCNTSNYFSLDYLFSHVFYQLGLELLN